MKTPRATLPLLRLNPVGIAAFARAGERLGAVRTADDLRALQRDLRATRDRIFGPLPDPATPVPVRAGKQVVWNGLAVRDVKFPSPHGYAITGWRFRRRDLAGRLPGLVIAAGHSEAGSLAPRYVRFAAYAARCGFDVLSFDPIGQGARREVFSPEDHPVYWSPCNQHQRVGIAALTAGFNLTGLFMSDCVTAVSVLDQDPGVDRTRIGFGGQSGGGYQTYLAMAADPRIAAAVPCQATYTRRGQLDGGTDLDMEQWCPLAWREGFDVAEMAVLFAPRPLRICAEYGCASQGGVFRLLQPLYQRLGCADAINIAAASMEHAMDQSCRELALNWLFRHLRPADPQAVEPGMPGFDRFHQRLTARVAGADARGCGVVALAQRRLAERPQPPGDPRRALRENPFLRPFRPSATRPPVWIEAGRGARGVAVIADCDGGDSPWAKRQARRAARTARRVVRVDVFATGAAGPRVPLPAGSFVAKYPRVYGSENRYAMWAFMAGTSPSGLALTDLRAAVRLAGAAADEPVRLAARGWPGIACILLSVTEPRVEACAVSGMPERLADVAYATETSADFTYVVPGLAAVTDLDACMASRPEVRFTVTRPLRLRPTGNGKAP